MKTDSLVAAWRTQITRQGESPMNGLQWRKTGTLVVNVVWLQIWVGVNLHSENI